MRKIKIRNNRSPKEMEQEALDALSEKDPKSLTESPEHINVIGEDNLKQWEKIEVTDSDGKKVKVYSDPDTLFDMKRSSTCDFNQDSIEDAKASRQNVDAFNQECGRKAAMAIAGERIKNRLEYEDQCIRKGERIKKRREHEEQCMREHEESQRCAHKCSGTCPVDYDCMMKDVDPECNVCYDDSLSEGEKLYKLGELNKVRNELLKAEAEILGLVENEDGDYVPKPIDFDPRETVEMMRRNAIEAKKDYINDIPEDLSGFYKANKPQEITPKEWQEATKDATTENITKGITDNGELPKYEMVNHPKHYNKYSVEVIDMFEKIYGAYLTAMWCEMTALKYRMRAGTKPTAPAEEDIEKEKWYLEKRDELMKRSIAGESDNGAIYPYAGEKPC